jgi:hypothetical protein
VLRYEGGKMQSARYRWERVRCLFMFILKWLKEVSEGTPEVVKFPFNVL